MSYVIITPLSVRNENDWMRGLSALKVIQFNKSKVYLVNKLILARL